MMGSDKRPVVARAARTAAIYSLLGFVKDHVWLEAYTTWNNHKNHHLNKDPIFMIVSHCIMSQIREETTKLTFADLLSPDERKQRELAPFKARFEEEKADAIDAIVRAVNDPGSLPYKIYSFRDHLDGYNEKGPLYTLWTEWLNEVRNQYPQLPLLQVKIPYYNYNDRSGGVPEKPYIQTDGFN